MKLSLPCLVVLIACGQSASADVVVGPSPYQQAADSPFAAISFAYFQLEDFADGSFNVPGATISGGAVLAPGPLTDSVDADDGVVDGSGQGGYSLLLTTASTLTVTFDAGVLGDLPTHAGAVWTDVGFALPSDGFAMVELEAFDAQGSSLGVTQSTLLGDGLVGGETAEDRFLGARHGGGIARIELRTAGSTDWEVDHIQYGRARGAYGMGCAGSAGAVPLLTVNGALMGGSTLNVLIQNALGGSSAFTLLGLTPASAPIGLQCSLLVAPLLAIAGPIPLAGSGPCQGVSSRNATLPIGTSGVSFTLQAFVIDPGSPLGFANSNGVQVVIP